MAAAATAKKVCIIARSDTNLMRWVRVDDDVDDDDAEVLRAAVSAHCQDCEACRC